MSERIKVLLVVMVLWYLEWNGWVQLAVYNNRIWIEFVLFGLLILKVAFFFFLGVRNVNVGNGASKVSDAKEGNNSPHQPQPNGSHPESKLELFGFDSLVNILGLKRYEDSLVTVKCGWSNIPLRKLDAAFEFTCYCSVILCFVLKTVICRSYPSKLIL